MTAEYPAHVFLDLHVRCNLRCVQCDIWKIDGDPPDQLTVQERIDVFQQVADWNPEIRVVLTGGELFLKRDILYTVAAAAQEHNVYTTMSSNGTLIRDRDIDRLPHSGIRCIVLSVDSDQPATHDEIRGVKGTFERVVRSITRLVEARDRANNGFSVLTSTILGRHNLDRVEPMVALFESLGVDTTLFQPIQPAFARELNPRWWVTDKLFPTDERQINEGIDAFLRLKSAGRRLFQTTTQFEDMRRYFKQPMTLHQKQCASMDNSLMVDLFGNVRLCFNMERIGLEPVANVRTAPLRKLWEDVRTEEIRQQMRGCQEACGTMICHAR